MQKLRILVSLITKNNDYQIEQARSAETTAQQLGMDAQIVFADGDAINQSTQILKAVQEAPELRPNAIVVEPAGGTAFPQVARAAVTAGIPWVILNRDAPYMAELRRNNRVPAFGVTCDQIEVGRIQGRQCVALQPSGGSLLYIQGPSDTSVAKERLLGFQEIKFPGIHLTTLKGQWTEESARRAVSSWLALTTSRRTKVDLIVSQNDCMAIGARKAFQELTAERERDAWLNIPYLGIDGVPKTGQAWVDTGWLAATVVTPPTTGPALQLLADTMRNGKKTPERTVTASSSFPPLDSLRRRA